jgi:hypothetical protein
MGGDIVQRDLPVAFIALIFGIREVPTEAITTIYRAAAFTSSRARLRYLCSKPGTTLFCSSSGSVLYPAQ